MKDLREVQQILLNVGLLQGGHQVEGRNFWLTTAVQENARLYRDYMLTKGVVPFIKTSQV